MKISISAERLTQVQADLLAIGVGSNKPQRDATVVALDKALGGKLVPLMKQEGFGGQSGEQLKLLGTGRMRAARLLIVGVGAELTAEEQARQVAVEAARAGRDLGSVAVLCPNAEDAVVAAAAEGVTTGAYRYTNYLTGDRRPKRSLKRSFLLVSGAIKPGDRAALKALEQDAAQRGVTVGEAVNLARDLVNAPPNDLYPDSLATAAKQACEQSGVQCRIFDEKGLEKLGMRLFLAVGQGSSRPPRMVHMTYKPKGKGPHPKVVWVGKGVTFDSGGLCLKPAGSMIDMKCDMAGAAVTIAITVAAAKLQLPIEVHGIFGAVENMTGAHAYRPGDVFPTRDGKTVEIINTDAEGRLVLAEVLTYARELEPEVIVDHATLTGACQIALGNHTAGLFTNDEELAEGYREAAGDSGESYWRLPLLPDLRESLKSQVADLKHTGSRFGGAISAALFLQEFVGDRRWAHIDVAGPAYLDRPHGIHPRGGTGFGVRTALKWLERMKA